MRVGHRPGNLFTVYEWALEHLLVNGPTEKCGKQFAGLMKESDHLNVKFPKGSLLTLLQ